MNIMEMQNLVVTLTRKKGHFKFMGKITLVTRKSKYLNLVYISMMLNKSRIQFY